MAAPNCNRQNNRGEKKRKMKCDHVSARRGIQRARIAERYAIVVQFFSRHF